MKKRTDEAANRYPVGMELIMTGQGICVFRPKVQPCDVKISNHVLRGMCVTTAVAGSGASGTATGDGQAGHVLGGEWRRVNGDLGGGASMDCGWRGMGGDGGDRGDGGAMGARAH